MFKRVLVAVLSVTVFLGSQVFFAPESSGEILGFREPDSYGHVVIPTKGKEYKIKRLVSQLYNRSKMMDAQRELISYGTQVTPYVLPLLKDKSNESVRIAALRIIAGVRDSSAEDEVAAMLRDRNQRVRKQAANTLSAIGKKATSIKPLKRLLRDPSPEVRYNAIKALAHMAPKEETDLFINALGDYDPRVRKFAVVALGNLKSKEAVPYLAQMVGDFDPGVRAAIVNALAEINTQECLQPMEWLTTDPDVNIRILALKRMGNLDAKGVTAILVNAADSPDPRVASLAIIALSKRDKEKALEIAKAHIDDEYTEIQMASIAVVGTVGSSSDKKLLEPLLRSESSRVRKAARRALVEAD